MIYCREAHAIDGDKPGRTMVEDPISTEERREVAKTFVDDFEFKIPSLLDNIDDKTGTNYAAHPDRLYLVGTDGKIAYAGAKGPQGFKPDELREAIMVETGKKKSEPKLSQSESASSGSGAPGRRPGGPGGFMKMLPVMIALDADQDGIVSADEIKNATQALQTLDKDKNGKLTEDELRPNRDAIGRGPQGQSGGRRGGRGGGGKPGDRN